jgi:IS605 OrfB family transposase
MLRTIKVAFAVDSALVLTALAFNQACQEVLDYGFQHRTYDKNVLNKATYRRVREALPSLPSALVQTARDEASEILRRSSYRASLKKRLSIRYDKRTFNFYPDQSRVSLTTVRGRLSFPFKRYAYLDAWRGEYTNAQLLIRRNRAFLNIQVRIPFEEERVTGRVLGIDRGVLNIAVCSDNTFYNSRRLRAIKRRYQYLKGVLQRVGTRSAHRKLQRLSGRERRFALDTNHCISKVIVSKQFDVFALERLHVRRTRKNGRCFNSLLGSWSPNQLRKFIIYKSETKGKAVVEVDPQYTS